MAINYATYFPAMVDIFDTAIAYQSAQNTDVPTAAAAMLVSINSYLDTVENNGIANNVVNSLNSYQNDTGVVQNLQTLATSITQLAVGADVPAAGNTIQDSLTELHRQMIVDSKTVNSNSIGSSVVSPSSSAPTLVVSFIGGDGVTLQQTIPETWIGTVSSGQLNLVSPNTVSQLSAFFQTTGGSGISLSLTPAGPTDGLLTNSSFDSSTIITNVPDSWSIETGVPTTNFVITVVEVQTVAISGTPTSGYYTLAYTDANSNEQITTPIAWNATASDVQSALIALNGLAQVTVTSTGTSPNFTHTVTYNGVAGNVANLNARNYLDTGSITVTQVTAGSTKALNYHALGLAGTCELLQLVTGLQPNQVIAVAFQGIRDSGATGLVRMALVDGTDTVINDDAGTANSKSVAYSSLTTGTFTQTTAFFRLPTNVPDYVYFSVKGAVTGTGFIYVDDLVAYTPQQAYTNGPYVALFINQRDLLNSDRYTATFTNSFAGKIQTWFWKFFNFQLPSAVSGNISE